MKDWKNGIIINRGKLGQGWIKPSDTDEGQIFTVVYACVYVCARETQRVGLHVCVICFHGCLNFNLFKSLT